MRCRREEVLRSPNAREEYYVLSTQVGVEMQRLKVLESNLIANTRRLRLHNPTPAFNFAGMCLVGITCFLCHGKRGMVFEKVGVFCFFVSPLLKDVSFSSSSCVDRVL